MGEEHKKEGELEAKELKQEGQVKKDEDKKEKEDVVPVEEKKEEEPQEIVLKVDMHCEACARKVARSLKGFTGVEEVTVDCKASKVVVKGKSADPIKVSERIQKKSGRKVEIVSPLPNPPPSPQENKDAPPPPPPEKQDEPPAVKSVVLKVQMHCEACAQVLQKRIRKIRGVESVTTDLASNEVTVKGFIDPEQLVSDLYKRTRKQAILVKNEEKKEEEKKEESDQKKEEKKPEDQEEKKEAAKENDDEIKVEVKKSEYWPAPKNYMEYYASTSYPPQFFSDENPNACSLM